MKETIANPSYDSMTPCGTTNLEQEIEKVSSFITAARRLLSDNKIVDMSSLEDTVTGLCNAVREVSRDNRDRVLLAMEKMIENLDQLAAELTGQNRTMVAQFNITPSLKSLDAYMNTKDR